jgi:hypothetical protein
MTFSTASTAIAIEDGLLRWANLPFTHGMDRGTIDSYCSHYAGLNP